MVNLNNNNTEEVAREILKVAGINANDIFNDTKATTAILKRASIVLNNFNATNQTIEEQKKNLKEGIKSQAQELIAQIGRHTTYFSLDGVDMRTQNNKTLHENCQKIADKLDTKKYNKLAKKALKFEKRKDERNLVVSGIYNLCIRTPQRVLKLVKSKTYDKLSSVAETPFSKIAVGALFIIAPIVFGITVPVIGLPGIYLLGGALILEGGKGLYDKWSGTNIEAESTKFQQSILDNIDIEKVLDINIQKQQDKAQDKGVNTTPSYEYYKQNSVPSYEYYNAQQKLKVSDTNAPLDEVHNPQQQSKGSEHHQHHASDLKSRSNTTQHR